MGAKIDQLKALWLAEQAAKEELLVAHREVRDSKHELGQLMDERTRLNVMEGFKGSAREANLEAEIQRVRDELSFARELEVSADVKVLECAWAIAVAMGK